MPDDTISPEVQLSQLVKKLQDVTVKQRELVFKLRQQIISNEKTITRMKKQSPDYIPH